MEEVKAGGPAEAGEHAGEEVAQTEVEESEGKPAEAAGGGTEGKENVEEESAGGNAMVGKNVFAENCSVCHSATGHGGNGGPDLTTQPKAKTLNGAIEQVTEGGGGMPAFAELLRPRKSKTSPLTSSNRSTANRAQSRGRRGGAER